MENDVLVFWRASHVVTIAIMQCECVFVLTYLREVLRCTWRRWRRNLFQQVLCFHYASFFTYHFLFFRLLNLRIFWRSLFAHRTLVFQIFLYFWQFWQISLFFISLGLNSSDSNFLEAWNRSPYKVGIICILDHLHLFLVIYYALELRFIIILHPSWRLLLTFQELLLDLIQSSIIVQGRLQDVHRSLGADQILYASIIRV